ncbi:MAG TPA: ArsR family transcriptional regulator [Ktedonobacteraceae bacterium]|nr:ArsR family transcriptional regulator [Ktedonobacteraceae bacterium]
MDATIATGQSPAFLKLLAHDLRWQLLTALAHSDYSVQELVQRIDEPQNLVSYHLRRMREQEVIAERRSSADRRDVYYSLDLARFQERYADALGSLHPALDHAEATQTADAALLEHKAARVLFLCTANSARSQMAEALTRHLSQGRVEAFSAGSHPTHLHPYAVQVMASIGIDISQQRSKHFDEFLGQSFDRIITVCDRVRESCPNFPGDPERIHWSIADPVAASGSEQEVFHAFEQVSLQLTNRIRFLLILLEREQRGTL